MTTAAAISATSTARLCRSSSSSSWSSPSSPPIDLAIARVITRRHHRRWLFDGCSRGHPPEPAAGDRRHPADVERVLACGSVAGAGRRRRPQPGRVHRAAARAAAPATRPRAMSRFAWRSSIWIWSPASSSCCCAGSCAAAKAIWKWRWRWCAPVIRAPARRSTRRRRNTSFPDVFVRRTDHGWIGRDQPSHGAAGARQSGPMPT